MKLVCLRSRWSDPDGVSDLSRFLLVSCVQHGVPPCSVIFPRSVLLLLLYVPVGRAQGDAHLYSAGTNLKRIEMAMLETATRSVDVARYSFTDREIAEELAKPGAEGRPGVGLPRPYSVSGEGRSEGVTATGILLAAGVEVRVKGARDLVHLKSYALDGRLLRTDRRTGLPPD